MIAAITAGGRVSDELATAIGTEVKALAPIGAGRLVDAAIDAAWGSGVRRVVVIGGDAVRAHCGARVDDVLPESANGRENIAAAMATGRGEALLLFASDMPFVHADMVRAFLDGANGADVALPLADGAAYERTYPGAPNHVTRIGRERVANGSVVYFAPGVAPRALAAAQALFDARKSLTRMATVLGIPLLLRFAVGRLRIDHVESRAKTLLGVRARAVRNASPGLCFDIDTAEDYRYAIAFDARS
jgi:CTP:molybdopterin cytidylyltransferase MocA